MPNTICTLVAAAWDAIREKAEAARGTAVTIRTGYLHAKLAEKGIHVSKQTASTLLLFIGYLLYLSGADPGVSWSHKTPRRITVSTSTARSADPLRLLSCMDA